MAIEGAAESAFSEAVLERVDSEYECELMIEALRRELSLVREQLAFLTHRLDFSGLQEQSPSPRPPARAAATVVQRPALSRQRKPQELKQLARPKMEVEKSASPVELAKQRHYLGVVDSQEEERWQLRKRCLQLMQHHIELQLQRVQETSEKFRRKMKRRQDRAKAARLQQKPPRFRSPGTDDRSFLNNLYQSTFYQIVGLEHKLRHTGKLKSLADLKEFWDLMLSSTLPEIMETPSPPRPRPLSHPLSIPECEEDYSNSWAITALPPEHYRERPLRTPVSKSASTPSIKFVPMKLPELRPVADIFNVGKLHLEEPRQMAAHVQRMHELSGERKRLVRMYQQARANEMAMRRLLPDIETPSFEPSPFPSHSGHVHKVATHRIEKQGRATTEEPAPVPLEMQRPEPPVLEPQFPLLQAQDYSPPPPHPPHTPSFPLTLQSPPPKPMPLPLTMEAMLETGTVREFKGRSVLWSNYT